MCKGFRDDGTLGLALDAVVADGTGCIERFLDVARTMGAAAVIQKPFTPDQVIKVVGRVLGQDDSTDEPLTPW